MNFFRSNESIGIFFVILAFLSFSILDAFQKTAVLYHSIFQLLLAKYIFVFFFSLSESYRKKNYFFFKSQNIKLQVFRSVLSIVESSFFILAFYYLPLAEVHSIGSLTPVIVVILSVIILKEHVSYKTWIAIFIGFIGVLVIMRPGLTIFDAKSFIPLLGAFFLSLYQIITRKVSKYDAPETSLFYNSIVGILLTSILSYFYWQHLNSFSFMFFLFIGIFFSLGLYFQIIALDKARASIIQPFHYTLIFWSIIWGYLFYNHLPDFFTLVGAVVITVSGIYVLSQKTQK